MRCVDVSAAMFADSTDLMCLDQCARTGAYRYLSLSLAEKPTVVRLSESQREELVMWVSILRRVFPKHKLYPLLHVNHAYGYGVVCGRKLWISKRHLDPAKRIAAADTIAHEIGHNLQPAGSATHGEEHKREMYLAFAKLIQATNGFTCWY